MQEKASIRLKRKRQNYQILNFLGKSHCLRFIGPSPHLAYRHGAALLGVLSEEMSLPVLREQEMGLVHFTQLQRVRDLPQLSPFRLINGNAAVSRPGGALDFSEHSL
jgi:hypothetical protein